MLRRRPGTLVTLAAAVAAAAAVGLAVAAAAGPAAAWRALGVAPLSPSFADLRNVLDALECARLGHDVLVDNPCDPWRRPLNYPRLWIVLLEPTGLDQRATAPLGVGLGAAFVAVVVASLRTTPRERAWVAAAALLSPPLCTLVERGNVDAAMFALAAVAAPRLTAPRLGTRALAWGALALAAALKLFPAFAVAAAAGDLRRRRTRLEVAAFGAAFAAYLALTRRDLDAIRQVLPRPLDWAYGRDVLPRMVGLAARRALPLLGPYELSWLGPALVLTALAGAHTLAARPGALTPDADEGLYLAGAGMYVGTLFVGHNHAYRLAVLLLCVPSLGRWSLGHEAPARLARSTLGLALVTLWCGTHALTDRAAVFLAPTQQVATWALAACVLAFSWRIATRRAAP